MQLDSTKDKQLIQGFNEVEIVDAKLTKLKEEKTSIFIAMADKTDIDKAVLRAAYTMYSKAQAGNDKPLDKNESAISIVNRLNNFSG